ncbi:YaiO family outer membrane beta-barrel protein [Ponticaulis profundi]|uniref:YaiO family outer membrane beta-barrel protein n=1 Tax=Ponticaulis profundi TaxID=2665222 RepID=A0ABW1S973_9PROT
MKPGALFLALSLFALASTAEAAEDISFEDGTRARYAGELDRAVDIFQRLTQENPDNSDAWVQLGLTYLNLQRLDEAEEALKRALRIAPDYEDAYLGLARVEWYRGNRSAAQSYLERAGTSQDANALRAQIDSAASGPRWRADASIGYSELTENLPGWSEGALSLGYRLSDATTLTTGLQYARRFDNTDLFLHAGLTHSLDNRALLYMSLGGAPDGDFRPEFEFRAGGDFPMVSSSQRDLEIWGQISASTASFASGDVQSASAGLQLRLDNDRYRIGARLIGLSDETDESRNGYALDGAWQVTDTIRLLSGYADSPETSEGVTVDVKSYHIGARFQFETHGFQVVALTEERGAYDRTGLVLATNWRF